MMETNGSTAEDSSSSSETLTAICPSFTYPFLATGSKDCQWSNDGSLAVLNGAEILILSDSSRHCAKFPALTMLQNNSLLTHQERILYPAKERLVHEQIYQLFKQLYVLHPYQDLHQERKASSKKATSSTESTSGHLKNQFTAIAWGPLGSGSGNNSCAIATISDTFRVAIYHPPDVFLKSDWIEVVNLSEKWYHFLLHEKKMKPFYRKHLTANSLAWSEAMALSEKGFMDDSMDDSAKKLSFLAIVGRIYLRVYVQELTVSTKAFGDEPLLLSVEEYGNILEASWVAKAATPTLVMGSDQGELIVTSIQLNSTSTLVLQVNQVIVSSIKSSILSLDARCFQEITCIVYGWNNQISVRSLASPDEEIRTWTAHQHNLTNVALTAQGTIFSVSYDGSLCQWDYEGNLLRRQQMGFPLNGLSISSNSMLVACTTLHPPSTLTTPLWKRDPAAKHPHSTVHLFQKPGNYTESVLVPIVRKVEQISKEDFSRRYWNPSKFWDLFLLIKEEVQNEVPLDHLGEVKKESDISGLSLVDTLCRNIQQLTQEFSAFRKMIFDQIVVCLTCSSNSPESKNLKAQKLKTILFYWVSKSLNHLVDKKIDVSKLSQEELHVAALYQRFLQANPPLSGSNNTGRSTLDIFSSSHFNLEERCPICGDLISETHFPDPLVATCVHGHKLNRCFITLRILGTTDRWTCPFCGYQSVQEDCSSKFYSDHIHYENNQMVCRLCGSLCE